MMLFRAKSINSTSSNHGETGTPDMVCAVRVVKDGGMGKVHCCRAQRTHATRLQVARARSFGMLMALLSSLRVPARSPPNVQPCCFFEVSAGEGAKHAQTDLLNSHQPLSGATGLRLHHPRNVWRAIRANCSSGKFWRWAPAQLKGDSAIGIAPFQTPSATHSRISGNLQPGEKRRILSITMAHNANSRGGG